MPALYPAFFFVLEKAVKSAGNEVIPTYPMHRSHGLQGSLKRRYKHPSPTSINGYHTAKKLLSQSPAKRPTLAFSGENGYTLGPAQRIAHNGSHAETGAFPSAITARLCAASEIPFIPPCFYIHTFPGSLWPLTIGRREKVSEDATATLSPTIPHCVFQLRSQMAHVRFHERKWVHTRLRQQDRTQRLNTPKQGRFGWGRYYYPRSISHVSETLRGQVSERQTLPLLGLGRGCSQRTQKAFGAAMRLCASLLRRRRGPAGPRNLFRAILNLVLF